MAKNKMLYGILAGLILTVALSGCGDGSDTVGSMAKGEADSAVGMPEAKQMEILNADNQEEAGDEVMLHYQTGELNEEEEAAVLEAMETLQRNLEVEEYLGEGIHMVSSAEWFETMAVRLYEGCRSYTLQQGERILLSVQVGRDVAGEPYSNVYYQADENRFFLLRQAGSRVSLLQTGLAEGEYDGAFESWLIDGALGEIKREWGTYSHGIMVGEYNKAVHKGTVGDVFDLWNNRENMEYETETIRYDEEGRPVETASPSPEATAAPTKAPAATKKPATGNIPAPTQKPADIGGGNSGGNTDGGSAGGSGGSNGGGVNSGGSGGNSGDGGNSGGSGGNSGGGNSAGGPGNSSGSNGSGNSGGGSSSDSGAGGSSSGGGAAGGDSGGSGDSGGASGGGDPGPAEGGDTDIDWSVDLLE